MILKVLRIAIYAILVIAFCFFYHCRLSRQQKRYRYRIGIYAKDETQEAEFCLYSNLKEPSMEALFKEYGIYGMQGITLKRDGQQFFYPWEAIGHIRMEMEDMAKKTSEDADGGI